MTDTPPTVPWWRSKRVWMFSVMLVARVVPVVWHDPAVKDICDWLLNLAGAGALGRRHHRHSETMRGVASATEYCRGMSRCAAMVPGPRPS
jgi:hypothetical protein